MARQFQNIPGMFVTYRDGNLVAPESEPETGNMALIDYALWGPVNEPVTVNSVEQVQTIYGKVTGEYGDTTRARGYNGNALARAALRALAAGNRNLTLVRCDFGGLAATTALAFVTVADQTSVYETNGVAPTDTTAGTSPIVYLDGHDLGITVGMRGWKTSGSTPAQTGSLYKVSSVVETATYGSTTANVTKVTFEPVLYTGGVGNNWNFGFGWEFSAAYPGKAGNAMSFKVTEDAENHRVVSVKVPSDFGGLNLIYSSEQLETFGTLTYKINYDLQDVMSVILFGIDPNTEVNTQTDGEYIVPTVYNAAALSDGYYDLGDAVTVDASAIGVFTQAGTDVDLTEFAGFVKDPAAYGVDRATKHEWYATALGNVNDSDDEYRTLPMLRGQEMGVVVVPSIYVDDMINQSTGAVSNVDDVADANVLQYLADFCHLQNNDGIPTICVMGCSPLTSTTIGDIRTRVALLKNCGFMYPTLVNTDGATEEVDAGRYLQLVAGPQLIVQDRSLGAYNAAGDVEYAALITTTPPNKTTTRKPLRGAVGMGFAFTMSQANDLAGGQGARKDGGAWVVYLADGGSLSVNYDGTAAARSSDYNKLYNFTVVQAAGNAVRVAVRPFLGNPFGAEQYAAMNTAIQSALDDLVDTGVIAGARGVGYDFVITQTVADAILGEASVALSVRPNFELDWVNVDVKLRV